MKKLKIIAIFALFINTLSALDFSIHKNNSKTLNAIMATGKIEYNDVKKLHYFLSRLPHKKNIAIYLNSPGGSLAGGIRLGRYFKQNRIKTIIEGYGVCASACALAFLGGRDYKGNKWMSSTTKSRLGFHAFSNTDGTKYSNTNQIQLAVAKILAYGRYVDAPMEIFIKNFSTPSNKMYWFSLQEQLRLGIKVWDIDNKRFITNTYIKEPYSHKLFNLPSPRYAKHRQSSVDFIREYYTQLKSVPLRYSWNKLSPSMKRQTSFREYAKWWGSQVSRVEVLSINRLNPYTVQAKLKFYMRNNRVTCSKDTFKLIHNGQRWLINSQKSQASRCN